MNKTIALFLALLLIPAALGATIQGSIYDFSLEKTEAVVTVNTTPEQKIVARGEYSFQVQPGDYKLTATSTTEEATSEEDISVAGQGEFIIDLILFPSVDVNQSLDMDEPIVNSEEFSYGNNEETWTYGLVIMIMFMLLTGAYFYYFKEEDNRLGPDSKAIYDFIKKEKRTTQKNIRNEFDHSQAKISLILTELEDKELIKKVKKGRGNVIILN